MAKNVFVLIAIRPQISISDVHENLQTLESRCVSLVTRSKWFRFLLLSPTILRRQVRVSLEMEHNESMKIRSEELQKPINFSLAASCDAFLEKISNFTWRWWCCTNCGCSLSHWCMIYLLRCSETQWEDPTWCNFISCNIEKVWVKFALVRQQNIRKQFRKLLCRLKIKNQFSN